MTTLSKALLFSDVHMTSPGTDIIGLSPQDRLERAIARATRDHPDADHIFFLGDLSHHGEQLEYKTLKAITDTLDCPITFLLGNHDRRAGFKAVFGHHGFQHGSMSLGGHQIIWLDTLDEAAPDRHSGHLCAERIAWLEQELHAADLPVIVLMHHHLALTGFNGMDAIALRNRSQVAELLAQSGKVRHIINGHIHRTIFTSCQGMPVSMLKSTCHQMPLALGEGSSSLSVDEPGAYGVLMLSPDHAVLHTEDVDLPNSVVVDEATSRSL